LSPESDDDAAQFQISHRTSALDSSAPIPPTDPYVLVLDAKGGEGASMLDLGGACEMDSFYCVLLSCISCLLSCIVIYV